MPRTKSPEQYREFARKIKSGSSVREALLSAGYSEKVANKGRAAITGPLLEALGEESKKLIQKGKQLDPKDLKNLLVGSLVQNVEMGEDRAHNSLKMLGNLKDVAAFERDSIAGTVIIEMPRLLPTIESMPILEGEEVKCLPAYTEDDTK